MIAADTDETALWIGEHSWPFGELSSLGSPPGRPLPADFVRGLAILERIHIDEEDAARPRRWTQLEERLESLGLGEADDELDALSGVRVAILMACRHERSALRELARAVSSRLVRNSIERRVLRGIPTRVKCLDYAHLAQAFYRLVKTGRGFSDSYVCALMGSSGASDRMDHIWNAFFDVTTGQIAAFDLTQCQVEDSDETYTLTSVSTNSYPHASALLTSMVSAYYLGLLERRNELWKAIRCQFSTSARRSYWLASRLSSYGLLSDPARTWLDKHLTVHRLAAVGKPSRRLPAALLDLDAIRELVDGTQ